MAYYDPETAPLKILECFEACLSRGNLTIISDDPVSLALWLGATQLLHEYMETKPKADATKEGE